MDPSFVSAQLEKGYAFWPGEVQQYKELQPFMNGEQGRLIARLPVEWAFHRDPRRVGLQSSYLLGAIDLAFWRSREGEYDLASRKDYPLDQWEIARVDSYIQAQGVRATDGQSYTGDLWYRTVVELSDAAITSNPRIRFPGLFNACELYVNGRETARRSQNALWWLEDFRFEWDVALGDRVRAGANELALVCHDEHHFGGVFRRPFIYAPIVDRAGPR
jgi:hypothetical protein